jgi:hypothetical protein
MARKVIVASGVELRDTRQGVSLMQFLKDNADFDKKSSAWTHPKGSGAKATFQVTVVFTAKELAAGLDTDDAYVVYSGHSRYGQGPAFGPARTPHVPDKKAFPVNPWGVHFRMGYDATDTEAVGDLVNHSVTPVEYDLTKTPAKAFLPKALVAAAAGVKAVEYKRKKGRLTKAQVKNPCTIAGAWRSFDSCWAKLAKTPTARGDTPLAGRHYYAYKPNYEPDKANPKGRDEFFVAVTVGSAHLDAASLKCKLFFMASCSSHEHFYGPLKRRRQAAKSDCKFLLTTYVNTASNARNFLEAIFKGHDPLTRKGSKAVLKLLNGYPDAGVIGMY